MLAGSFCPLEHFISLGNLSCSGPPPPIFPLSFTLTVISFFNGITIFGLQSFSLPHTHTSNSSDLIFLLLPLAQSRGSIRDLYMFTGTCRHLAACLFLQSIAAKYKHLVKAGFNCKCCVCVCVHAGYWRGPRVWISVTLKELRPF